MFKHLIYILLDWVHYTVFHFSYFSITYNVVFDFSLKVVRLLYQWLFAVQSPGCKEFFDFGQFPGNVKEVVINPFKKLDLLIRFRGVCETKRIVDRFNINLYLKLWLIIPCDCII